MTAIGAPHMSAAELALFERTLRTSRAYCEFGMGGSSLLAARLGIPAAVMVDSDGKWVSAVRDAPEVAAAIASGAFDVLHADIGPVRDWGNPVDHSHVTRWSNYIATAWTAWAARKAMPDLVFVDGRFRVACCCSVVAACAGRATPIPRVMIHDFNDERPQYREVLEFFEIEAQAESLCLLTIRADASPLLAMSRMMRRQFDYG